MRGFWKLAAACLILALGAGCTVYRYRECRAAGFSVIYCLDRP